MSYAREWARVGSNGDGHCLGLTLLAYQDYPSYLINCRHFVAMLGDNRCEEGRLEGTKVIVFRYEMGRNGNNNDAVGRREAVS